MNVRKLELLDGRRWTGSSRHLNRWGFLLMCVGFLLAVLASWLPELYAFTTGDKKYLALAYPWLDQERLRLMISAGATWIGGVVAFCAGQIVASVGRFMNSLAEVVFEAQRQSADEP